MHISPSWRSLWLFLAGLTPAAVLVFLFMSDFFSAWQGRVVSVRPSGREEPAVLQVLIVTDEGASLERRWDTELVQQLKLPRDPQALPPLELPEGRPATRKSRFSMSFDVLTGEGTEEARWLREPTTSPAGLAIAGLFWLVLLGLRNMVYAGSPLAIEPREAYLPPRQAPAGSPAGQRQGKPKKRRGGKGPPPPGRRRGTGRR